MLKKPKTMLSHNTHRNYQDIIKVVNQSLILGPIFSTCQLMNYYFLYPMSRSIIFLTIAHYLVLQSQFYS